MAWVYRYTDLADGIIKYVGVVWGKTRTLEQRLKEHERDDTWCNTRRWKIEYIEEDIETRAEAEAFETHFIELYGTGKYFNTRQVGFGLNKFLPDYGDKWKIFGADYLYDTQIKKYNERIKGLKDSINTLIKEQEKLTQEHDNEILKLEKLKSEIKQSKYEYKLTTLEFKAKQPKIDIDNNLMFSFDFDDVIQYYNVTKDDSVIFNNILYDMNGVAFHRTALRYDKENENIISIKEEPHSEYVIAHLDNKKHGDELSLAMLKVTESFNQYYPDKNIYQYLIEYAIQISKEFDWIFNKYSLDKLFELNYEYDGEYVLKKFSENGVLEFRSENNDIIIDIENNTKQITFIRLNECIEVKINDCVYNCDMFNPKEKTAQYETITDDRHLVTGDIIINDEILNQIIDIVKNYKYTLVYDISNKLKFIFKIAKEYEKTIFSKRT